MFYSDEDLLRVNFSTMPNFKWILLIVFWLSSSALGAQTAAVPNSEVGVVTEISKGILYIGGVQHSIVSIDTKRGIKRVAVQTMGVMQPLKVGESLSFAGPYITVSSELIVNTNEGFMFRPAEKSMAEHMQEMMGKAEAQAKEMEESGIPNAVPILLTESKEQTEERSYKRRTDLIIAVLTLVVALLAFKQIRRFMAATRQWIKSLIAKSSSLSEKQSVQQNSTADGSVDVSPRRDRG